MNEISASFSTGDQEYKFEDITRIWPRIKPSPYTINDLNDIYVYEFIQREWQYLLKALSYIYKSKWINNGYEANKQNNKIIHYILAKECGFCIPQTIISNDITRISNFLRLHSNEKKEIIQKPITYYYCWPNVAHRTNVLTADLLSESSESIKICPSIFQNRLSKREELRISVFHSEVYSVQIGIDTTDHNGLVDWRNSSHNATYKNVQIKKELKEKLLKLHHRLSLDICTYDIIIDDSGDAYFIDANPSGQWLWLENQLNLPMTHTFISSLLEDI